MSETHSRTDVDAGVEGSHGDEDGEQQKGMGGILEVGRIW